MKSGIPGHPRTVRLRGYGDDFELKRRLFVIHQQGTARRAICVGSLGAARAALRVVRASDFEDPDAAVQDLQVIRDPAASEDDVIEAVKRLVVMKPDRELPEDGRRDTERMFAVDRAGIRRQDR